MNTFESLARAIDVARLCAAAQDQRLTPEIHDKETSGLYIRLKTGRFIVPKLCQTLTITTTSGIIVVGCGPTSTLVSPHGTPQEGRETELHAQVPAHTTSVIIPIQGTVLCLSGEYDMPHKLTFLIQDLAMRKLSGEWGGPEYPWIDCSK